MVAMMIGHQEITVVVVFTLDSSRILMSGESVAIANVTIEPCMHYWTLGYASTKLAFK